MPSLSDYTETLTRQGWISLTEDAETVEEPTRHGYGPGNTGFTVRYIRWTEFGYAMLRQRPGQQIILNTFYDRKVPDTRRVPADRIEPVITSTPGDELVACGWERSHLPFDELVPGMQVLIDAKPIWVRLARLIKQEEESAAWEIEIARGRRAGQRERTQIYGGTGGAWKVSPCVGILRAGDQVIEGRRRWVVESVEPDGVESVKYTIRGKHGASTRTAHRSEPVKVAAWAGE